MNMQIPDNVVNRMNEHLFLGATQIFNLINLEEFAEYHNALIDYNPETDNCQDEGFYKVMDLFFHKHWFNNLESLESEKLKDFIHILNLYFNEVHYLALRTAYLMEGRGELINHPPISNLNERDLGTDIMMMTNEYREDYIKYYPEAKFQNFWIGGEIPTLVEVPEGYVNLRFSQTLKNFNSEYDKDLSKNKGKSKAKRKAVKKARKVNRK